jgi:hypothetical protein
MTLPNIRPARKNYAVTNPLAYFRHGVMDGAKKVLLHRHSAGLFVIDRITNSLKMRMGRILQITGGALNEAN